ncbi:MAG: hypothetical protein DWH79_08565 [Planctomycetota bacterium]|nr:MAG: hypothetical protein DWH79_08565 [Planctomycetota bacterium]
MGTSVMEVLGEAIGEKRGWFPASVPAAQSSRRSRLLKEGESLRFGRLEFVAGAVSGGGRGLPAGAELESVSGGFWRCIMVCHSSA